MKPRLFLLNLILDSFGENSFYCITLYNSEICFQGEYTKVLRDKINLFSWLELNEAGNLLTTTTIAEFKVKFVLTNVHA